MVIKNSKEAGDIVKSLLANGGDVCQEFIRKRTDNATHIELISKHSNKVHYVKYSKRPFEKFGQFFPAWIGEEGESVDNDVIQRLGFNDYIYFAHPDGIHRIEMRDFIKPKLTRTTRKGDLTWSFPIGLMELFMEV